MNQELESWVGDVKYKEWYFNPVCKYRCEVNQDGIGLSGNEVHVIEYSALESAQSEIERLKKELEELKTNGNLGGLFDEYYLKREKSNIDYLKDSHQLNASSPRGCGLSLRLELAANRQRKQQEELKEKDK